jgi:pSer/pThr/pTyr-binding forkhead associated (FHA) protein
MPLRFRLVSAPGRSMSGRDRRADADPDVNFVDVDGDAASRAGDTDIEQVIDVADQTGEVRIGRRADLELSLPFPALSAVHARLAPGKDDRRGTWILEDLGSKNGTFVDGERMSPGQRKVVTAGARLGFAQVTVVFEGPAPAAATGNEGTGTLARRIARDVLAPSAGGGVPTLLVIRGRALGQSLRLTEQDRRYVVGRVEGCDLQLIADEISREHVAFVRRWDGVFATDLGSKNGIRVNNQPVTQHRLSDGDVIRVGTIQLRFNDPEARYLRDYEARAAQGEGAPAREVVEPPNGISAGSFSARLSRPAPAAPPPVVPATPITDEPPPVRSELHAHVQAHVPPDDVPDPETADMDPDAFDDFTPRPRHGTRTAMIVAAAVLFAVTAIAVVLALS